MALITGTTATRVRGVAGQLPAGQSGGLLVESAVAGESIPVGVGVVAEVSGFTAVTGSVALPAALAASASALVASVSGLGTAAGTTFALAGFTGGYAGERLNPPRPVTLTLASDADWDATTATIEGEDLEGNYLKESVAIPNGGNATVSTDALFAAVTLITIPAQTASVVGAAGFGAAPANASLDCAVVTHSDQLTNSFGSALSVSSASNFADGDDLSMVVRGRVIVHSENAAKAGDPVYVRHTAGAGEQKGAFRSTPDSTDCYRASGWRFRTDSSGSDNVAEIEKR